MTEGLLLNDTIAAISTPVGKSGIGIIRLSGQGALALADKVFVSAKARRPSRCLSHTIHYGWVKDGTETIDEVLLTVMRAPRTYTREDIVEINCHSGIVVLRKILQLLLRRGARLAAPGEFTRRAYLSGRIDLAQAEAVLDVINSQTEAALGQALGQLKGRLSRKIQALRQDILAILTQLELAIDFSDQDIPPMPREELLKKSKKIFQTLQDFLDSAARGMLLRQGLTCVICGKTNVGKSSLLNALLKKERAIVTPMPGTTRDALEETIDLKGIPLRLVDTAGIIRGRNLAEREAVKRSRQYIRQADVVLLVLDASRRLSAEDLAIAREISAKAALVVLNKEDLPAKINAARVEKLLPGRLIQRVSARRGRGLKKLEQELAEFIWQGRAGTNGEVLVTNLRHQEALKKAARFIQQAIKAVKANQGLELVALEVKAAKDSLGEIIGQIDNQAVLERVFAQFCIGK